MSDQMSSKPYSRGHRFALIFKELYQNVCLDDRHLGQVGVWGMLGQKLGLWVTRDLLQSS